MLRRSCHVSGGFGGNNPTRRQDGSENQANDNQREAQIA